MGSPTTRNKSRRQATERPEPIRQPRLGPAGWARWAWRQLTSMRTALFLLLILAVAAVPGSIFPQRSINAARTAQYLQQHPTIGPVLDKVGMFDVFSAPWFAAIYLLLLISLVGCIVPRLRVHLRSWRSPLPRVPRRLDRLPAHAREQAPIPPDQAIAAAHRALRARRYRVRVDEPAGDGRPLRLAAESGRLRETGNLLFHISLLLVIVSVAYGHLVGWRGDVIVPVGQTFTSTASNYDTLNPGPWVNTSALTPFSLKLNSFKVTFEDQVPKDSPQYGQPRTFLARVTSQTPGEPARTYPLRVNHALDIAGDEVYLLGNGYAPMVTVRDADGKVLYHQATPFLPQNNTYKSTGTIKVTAASPKQLGFFGFFLPTASFSKTKGPTSTFPGLKKPALVLGLYEGNLFPGGAPQSVYTLNTKEMTQVKATDGKPLRLLITPGQTVTLPHHLGSITLNSVPHWAGLSVRHDPGKMPALAGSLLALLGLIMSMTLRRRRIFVTVQPAPDAQPGGPLASLVTVGGMAKGNDPRLQATVDRLLENATTKTGKTSS